MSDGNGGANYAITFVTDTTGVITARSITVTATTDTKTYDATTSSGPSRPSPPGRSPARHRSVHPDLRHRARRDRQDPDSRRLCVDGNVGANYAVTFVSVDTGVITGRAITVTAATDTKVYDATTSSDGVPTVTSGSLASGDTATFTQTFGNADVGTGKTLTPAGMVNDGNGGASYTVTFVNDTTGEITARAITVTATTDTRGYDATNASAAIPPSPTARSRYRHRLVHPDVR